MIVFESILLKRYSIVTVEDGKRMSVRLRKLQGQHS